ANTSGYPEALKDPNVLAPNIILVGHGHFDHFDPDALRQIMEPSPERTPYLLQLFEFSALTQKMMPEETGRGQLLPVNMGAWINKENMQAAYNVGESYPDDVDIAAIFATHSSGVFSPIK
ncbi:MAG: hypothetical protein Q8P16_01435, partial [bacterium]|nr:hypothetical protein [bacterium]